MDCRTEGRSGPFRFAITLLCLVLGLAVSTQAAAITLDKALHAAQVNHSANMALGDVHHGHHDGADHHHDNVDHPEDEQGHPGAPEPAHHHHYADTGVALIPLPGTDAPNPGITAALSPPLDTSRPPETTRDGLERPPKRG